MEKNFKLTRLDNKKLKNLRIISLILWIVFTIIAILVDKYEWKFNPFIYLILLLIVTNVIAPVIYPRFKFIGELIIGSNKIQVHENGKDIVNFQIETLEKVGILFRGAKGESFYSLGFTFKDGAENKLTLQYKDNIEEFEFYSDNQMDYKTLNRILLEISKKGIKVSLERIENKFKTANNS